MCEHASDNAESCVCVCACVYVYKLKAHTVLESSCGLMRLRPMRQHALCNAESCVCVCVCVEGPYMFTYVRVPCACVSVSTGRTYASNILQTMHFEENARRFILSYIHARLYIHVLPCQQE